MDLAGDVALQAPGDLALGLAFGETSLDVGAGGWVHAHSGGPDGVDRAIQLPVTATVQLMPRRVGRRSRDWARSRDLGAASERLPWVGPHGHADCGGDGADSSHLQQDRNVLGHQWCHLVTVGLEVLV